jgi:hypothetical protein
VWRERSLNLNPGAPRSPPRKECEREPTDVELEAEAVREEAEPEYNLVGERQWVVRMPVENLC